MYNSSPGSNQDDANLTIIDPSYLYDNNGQPTSNSVLRHLQQANHAKTTNCDNKNDYIYVEHDRLELAEQIERILKYYQQDLKQESNTLSDCNQQLIIRLVDFIRPIYSTKEEKLKDLDALIEDISVLQALPLFELKEKIEQLNKEISHLKKLIITSTDEGDRSHNTMTKVYQINSMVNYEHWREMEEDTRKLHNLVETQRDKINELINLIAQQDKLPVDNTRPTSYNANPENASVIPKMRASTDQQQASGTNQLENSTDEFHSLGVSPIHSLTDFLTKPFVGTVNNQTQNEERPIVSVRTLPPLSRLSSYADIKKCPICNHEFPRATDEFEIYSHVEACLNPSASGNNVPTQINEYECPNCNRRFPDDDKVYLEHLTNCFNERYNFNPTLPSIKQNDFLQLIRTCPFCQAIFNVLTIDEQQFQQHIKAHSHQKPR